MAATATATTITLVSSDGQRFEVTHEAAALSRTIRHMIEDGCVENGGGGVPLPNVASGVLAKVVEYCDRHACSDGNSTAAASVRQDLKSFDDGFMEVDQTTLFGIVLAASFLDYACMVDGMIKGRSVEEIRAKLSIKNYFTPEEEAEIKMEIKREKLLWSSFLYRLAS